MNCDEAARGTDLAADLVRANEGIARVRELHQPVEAVTYYRGGQPVTQIVCCRCIDYGMDEDRGGNLYMAADREPWPCETRHIVDGLS